jgi:hypothetical protein
MMLIELRCVVSPRFEGLDGTSLSTLGTHLDATVYAVAEEVGYIYSDS